MSKLKRNGNKNYLPNQLNKYSIRKFSVGTASIIVGATLLFGAGQDAKAAEAVSIEESNKDASSAETPTSTEEPATVENTTTEASTEQPSTEEAATTEVASTEKVSTEQPSTEEKASTEEVSTEQPTEEKASTEEVSTEQPSTEEKASTEEVSTEQPSTEEKASTEEVSTEQPSTEEKASTKEVSTEQPTEEKASTEEVSTEQSSTEKKPSTEEVSTEQPATAERAATSEPTTNSVVSSTEEPASTKTATRSTVSAPEAKESLATTDNKEAFVNNYIDSSYDVETAKAVKENLNVDYANATDAEIEEAIQAAALIAMANSPEAPVATPAIAPRNVATTYNMSNTTDNYLAGLSATTGSNVNDIIQVTSASITQNYIEPNNSGNFKLESSFKTLGPVKGGDYFTVKIDENVSIDGDADYSKLNNEQIMELVNSEGYKVADGVYNTETKELTYTFTDYVNNKSEVTGSFSLSQFIDRKNTQDSGIYNLNYNIAGESLNETLEVNFGDVAQGNGVQSITSMITDVDYESGSNDYTQYIYVNPQDNELYNANVILQGYLDDPSTSSGQINTDVTDIQVFYVDPTDKLTESYYVDESNYENVSNNLNIYQDGQDRAIVELGNISQPYIIKVTSKYDESGNPLKLRSILESSDVYGNRGSYFWDNTTIVTGNEGNADGVNKRYNLGDFVWEDSNKDGIQNSNEKGISGVEVTLTKPDGTTETTTTNDEGKYNFTGLENGNYTVNFKTPEGYEATVVNNGDDALDSDGSSVEVTINNANDYTIDSGYVKPVVETPKDPAKYELGDYVWEDSNNDGIQNSNEKGISGVEVTLTKPDGTTETTTTNDEGKYNFTGLENGNYTVNFKTPEGYEATVVNNGDDALDSDGSSVEITINNANDYTIDSSMTGNSLKALSLCKRSEILWASLPIGPQFKTGAEIASISSAAIT
ncbi:MSCRAMM family adhesin SdrC [Staphylococcus massiliensis]|nr:MSCRAMM family adhesin SdrC [Staphylococcus massiliensis]